VAEHRAAVVAGGGAGSEVGEALEQAQGDRLRRGSLRAARHDEAAADALAWRIACNSSGVK
jgi:hypothetical protein